MLFKGKVGDDLRTGTAGDDTFLMYKGGDDTVLGLGGDDVFKFSSAFTAADRIDGGADHDTLILKGDYFAGTVFQAATLTNVEEIRLAKGKDYALTTHDGTVAAGQVLQVNGFRMEAADRLFFDGSAETDGAFWITSGEGDDRLTGGDGADVLRAGSGNDTANGGSGDDVVNITFFNESDSIVGGDGHDRLVITGNGIDDFVIMNSDTLDSVETIVLRPGFDGQFIMHDGNVAAGENLNVNGFSATRLGFDGSAETDGRFNISGSAGADTLVGGAQADRFNLSAGGNDNAFGGDGADDFYMGGQFTASDSIAGGLGSDTVHLDGMDADDQIIFTGSTMSGVEDVILGDRFFNLITNDATVAAAQVLSVDGSAIVTASTVFLFDGSAETDGAFSLTGGMNADSLEGGAGGDTLSGGGGGDTLVGRGGADQLTGGAGSDVFEFLAVAESTSTGHDLVVGLDLDTDKFFVSGADLAGVNGTVSGTLSQASFDADLAAAVGAGQLGVDHALIFTATLGDLSGRSYLIIERDGAAGYQGGGDYVIEITGYTGTLDAGDIA